MERKGFSKSNYKQRHPGGKLGAILQKVSDLMHTGDEMPILDEHAALRQIILTMSSKMLGCVGIINENGDLSGMITDGDLRGQASSLDQTCSWKNRRRYHDQESENDFSRHFGCRSVKRHEHDRQGNNPAVRR